MTKWKGKLKSFPVDGSIRKKLNEKQSSENVTTLQLVEEEAESLAESFSETYKSEYENPQNNAPLTADNAFGKLLSYLRENQQTHFLVLCRKIEKVSLEGTTLKFESDDEKLLQELESESFEIQVKEFLNAYGLSLKFDSKVKKDNDLERLKDLVGNKLQIK